MSVGRMTRSPSVLIALGAAWLTPLNSPQAEITSYRYDALGRVINAANSDGTGVGYDYDKAGNRTRVGALTGTGPAVSISPNAASTNEGDSGTTPFVFTVTRTGAISTPISVSWATAGSGANPADAADFVGNAFPSGILSFLAAEAGPKTIVVPVAGDTYVEPDEEFTVTLSNAVGGAIGIASASQVIRNDDSAVAVVANPDAGSTVHTSPLTLDPRLNDTGGSLTITGVTQPTVGGVVTFTSGSVTFTPTFGFEGVATFTYTVTNGGTSATGTISITVGKPPIANPDIVSTPYGATVIWNPTTNDTGTQPFIFSHGSSADTTPQFVGLVVSAGNNNVSFTPYSGFYGTVRVPYTIYNAFGQSTSYSDVTVVGPQPVAATDNVSTPYQTSITLDPRANDGGVGPLTITGITQPSYGVSSFTASSVTYTPNAGHSGWDTFTYTLSNPHGSTAGAVVIQVDSAPPVQGPVAANDHIVAKMELLIPDVGPWWGHGCVDALANDSGTSKSLLSVAPSQTSQGGVPYIANGQVCYDVFDYIPSSDSFTYTMSGIGGTSTATVTVSFTY